MNELERFAQRVHEINPMQAKHLRTNIDKMSDDEKSMANKYIKNFNQYLAGRGIDEDFIVRAIISISNEYMKDKFYFLKYGVYRRSTEKEAYDEVYSNQDMMTEYLIWLAYSNFIIYNHRQMLAFFKEFISEYSGRSYLEIGPGHGLYFYEAVKSGAFDEYMGIDLSRTSIEMTGELLENLIPGAKYRLELLNLFDFDADTKFDFISCGEVLEHVEAPEKVLGKIHSLLTDDGRAFLSTAVNAPAPDHIYLFRSESQATEMIKKAGFDIVSTLFISVEDIPRERWLDENAELSVAYIVGKAKNR